MTNEEAIDTLRCAVGSGCHQVCNEKNRGQCKDDEVIAALDMAIKALEKQIPKVPIGTEVTYRCPACCKVVGLYSYVRRKVLINHHCVCGQCIKSPIIEVEAIPEDS